ncbi:MAG: hypothetical protein ACE5LH_07635 [Fidelibacterota bacterium]
MVRLILILVVALLVVAYLYRKRLKAFSYTVRSILQNPMAKAQLLRSFFYSLGRIARIVFFRRFFRL